MEKLGEVEQQKKRGKKVKSRLEEAEVRTNKKSIDVFLKFLCR